MASAAEGVGRRARGGLLPVCTHPFVNALVGALALWQPRMAPAPAHPRPRPQHHPGPPPTKTQQPACRGVP